jgi:hypothetical protein
MLLHVRPQAREPGRAAAGADRSHLDERAKLGAIGRLEREAQRNIELMWLTGRLMPDFKTIADFRKDNGVAIRAVCRQFMVLCRRLNLFTEAVVAIDGSKFKAVNNRDKNFTPNKIQRRMEQIEASIGRYMAAMDAGDRQEGEVAQAKSTRLKKSFRDRKGGIASPWSRAFSGASSAKA